MAQTEQEIREFLTAVDAAAGLWGGIDVRVMAFLVEGEWHNALTRCRLTAEEPAEIPRLSLFANTERVATRQAALPLDALPALVEGFATGRIIHGDLEVTYLEESHDQREERKRYSSAYCGLSEPAAAGSWTRLSWVPVSRAEWPTLEFRSSGSRFDEVLRALPRTGRDLDGEIHALRSPLDGVAGVAEHVIGLREGTTADRTTGFHVVAAFQARLDETGCRIHDGELEITVLAGSHLATARTEVGYVIRNGDEVVVADTCDFAAEKWTAEGGRWKATVRVASGAGTVATLLLRIAGRRIERLQIEDYDRPGDNPRLALWAAADPGLSILTTGLQPTARADGSNFERAAARLLSLLGFQVLALGPEKLLSDGPDFVAFNPHGKTVLVVECTTGALGASGKLSKLLLRSNEWEELLQDREVRPVLLTSARRSLLSEMDLAQAARDRVAVLAAEEVTELLQFAADGVPVARVAAYCASKVPPLPRDLHPADILSRPR